LVEPSRVVLVRCFAPPFNDSFCSDSSLLSFVVWQWLD
jgi:hypothetical protein